jgi:hypothetical protein
VFSPRKSGIVSLDVALEDRVHAWFFAHVNPFTRITHAPVYNNEVSNIRLSKSTMAREIKALIFAVCSLAVAAMPAATTQRLLGHSRAELMRVFQYATERALCRANYLRAANEVQYLETGLTKVVV